MILCKYQYESSNWINCFDNNKVPADGCPYVNININLFTDNAVKQIDEQNSKNSTSSQSKKYNKTESMDGMLGNLSITCSTQHLVLGSNSRSQTVIQQRLLKGRLRDK